MSKQSKPPGLESGTALRNEDGTLAGLSERDVDRKWCDVGHELLKERIVALEQAVAALTSGVALKEPAGE